MHDFVVCTAGSAQRLMIPAKRSGPGSGANGGEFLMLALATCYCNGLYREAVRIGVILERVDVEAEADFPGVGLAATAITYRANVTTSASAAVIADSLRRPTPSRFAGVSGQPGGKGDRRSLGVDLTVGIASGAFERVDIIGGDGDHLYPVKLAHAKLATACACILRPDSGSMRLAGRGSRLRHGRLPTI